jgi:hypothetical protein
MTRKHFKALAEAIRRMNLSKVDKLVVIEAICEVCASFNNGFKYSTFHEACGLDELREGRHEQL